MNRIKRSSIALIVNFIVCFCLYNPALCRTEEPSNELLNITIGTSYGIPGLAFAAVPVTLNYSPYDMYGFDFLMKFDASAISFFGIIDGTLFFSDSGCAWEYFAYRYYDSSSSCGAGSCPTGTIRVVGFADVNADPGHPNCYNPNVVAEFFTIRFLVPEDIDSTCWFIPVEFVWFDCGDNLILFTDPDGPPYNQQLAAANNVFSRGEVLPPSDSFPSLGGPADSCLNDSSSNYPLLPLIDFYNGGVYIKCQETEFLIGDIDLDGIPYGQSDADLYRKYFLEGESVFEINRSKQIAATGIIVDVLTLRLAGLVQLERIVHDDLNPDSAFTEPIFGENYAMNDREKGIVSLFADVSTPRIWLNFFGQVSPIDVAEDLLISSKYDGQYTRIIIENQAYSETGLIILFEYSGKGDLVEFQASSLKGEIISYEFLNCGLDRPCRITTQLGDINLNGIRCEVADWALFQSYFVYGEAVFSFDLERQIYNSDMNVDNLFLTIEDLVLFTRIITGNTPCVTYFDSTSPNTASFRQNELTQQIEVVTPDSLGAVVLVINGEIIPAVYDTNNFTLEHNFNNGLTKLLIMPKISNGISLDSNFITEGPLISYTGSGQLIKAHTATYLGAKVNSVIDVSTDIADNPDNLPTKFALYNNYPNPFNIETTIKFDLPRASEVEFEIINILGQLVYDVSSRYSAGSHTIYWDGGSNSGQTVASGVYYYRITAGDFISSKKMILLK